MDPRFSYYAGIAVFCIALMLSAGCSGEQPPPIPTVTPTLTPAPGTVDLRSFGEQDNGGMYTVPLDAEVTLRLPENPSTGFSWNLALTAGLVVLNDSYAPNETAGQLVGSGGIHTWKLVAAQPGMQTISGVYARPWESAPPAAQFRLTLLVSGPCGNATCSPPSAPPRFHVYTEEDDGKLVKESLGEEFNVRLGENPSTGYSWNFSVSEGLRIGNDEFISSWPEGQAVGAGGIRSVYVETVRVGEQTVAAEYRRPWMAHGTVTHVDLEGGFYGIVADDGAKYLPLNLEEKYRKDGLRVAFDSEIVKDAATIQMWGVPVNLTFIEGIRGYGLRVSVA
jgi:inhibitor of cysteine peptidase